MKHLCSVVALFFVCAVVLASAQDSISPPTSLPLGSAVISDTKGEVFVTLADQSVANPAQKGQILPSNTTLECKKGSALLALADGSQILVKPNTRVILRAPEQSKGNFLEQLIGKITATVKKRTGNDPPFKIGTPTAVITVRGTKFEVEVSKRQQTFVQVFEGLVEVNGLSGTGHSVFVQPGYITQVSVNRSPEKPRKLFEDSERGTGGSTTRSGKETDAEGRSGRQSGGTGTNSGGDGQEVDD